MNHEPVKAKFVTPASITLALLMILGGIVAVIRYWQGLGAVTNLSDSYPWGLWISVDIMCGVALAAGAFTVAAAVYIFGGEKYHMFVRPAVLTGLLGYVFVGVALLVDLGLPWRIWHPIIMWPEHSVMFEVAWCVMLYMSVLALEFAPAVFERFGWDRIHGLWRRLVPAFSVIVVAFFTYIMSHSVAWAVVVLVVFAVVAAVVPSLFASRPGVPIILVMVGIVLSTMHQSSLGSLFLLMPGKLHALWWTPMLPINFFLSAVAVGFAMVIFEAMLSARFFGRSLEQGPLAGLGRLLCGALWICLAVRIIDVLLRGELGGAFVSGKGFVFLVDVLVGLGLPALILSSARARESMTSLFTAATLAIVGVVFNRLSVALLGMTIPGKVGYFPSIGEFIITIAMVSAVVLLFTLAAKIFPVFTREEQDGFGLPAAAPRAAGNR